MNDDSTRLDALADAWSLTTPRTFTATTTGLNNHSWRVENADGVWFLREYRNTRDRNRVAYEHALLLLLEATGLPFRVPIPVQTPTGQTFLAQDDALFALTARIPGTHPERGNPTHAAAAGRALGLLDAALATLRDLPPSPLGTYGNLAFVHPRVPDPFAVLDVLPFDRDHRDRFAAILRETLDAVPGLYRDLPTQIIHGDYGNGNALLVGDMASGILDFEVASPDLRVMDLAVGLYYHALNPGIFSCGVRPECIAAFSRGYLGATSLRADELHALPRLLLLMRLTSQVHWTGRFLNGLDGEMAVRERFDDTLALADWLTADGAALVAWVERGQREAAY